MRDLIGWAVREFEITSARATVLLLAVLALSQLARRWSAATRHRLWCGATMGLLLLPLGHTLLPSLSLPLLTPHSPDVARVDASLELPTWQLPPRAHPDLPATADNPVRPETKTQGAPPLAHNEFTFLVALGWLLGATVVGRRFLRARLAARRLLVGTSSIDPLDCRTPTNVSVRTGAHVELPMTVGALRPVILVPPGDETWPSGWRTSVLAHEVAHVRARDPLFQLLSELTLVAYWFHPLVWLAARQLRTERELAADDEVLAAGIPASHYAEVLVALGCVPADTATSGAVLPLLTPAGLKARLLAILDGARPRGLRGAARVSLPMVALVLFVPTGPVQSWCPAPRLLSQPR